MQKKSSVRTGIDGVTERRGNAELDPIMGVRRGRLNRLQCDTGRKSPPKYEGVPVPWQDIADWIEAEDGIPISRQRVQALTNELLTKILRMLIDDPYIREYAEQLGVDFSTGDLRDIRGGRNGHANI